MRISDDERREVAARLRNGGIARDEKEAYVLLLGRIGIKPQLPATSTYEDAMVRMADLIEPQPIDGNTSDGYHTFNELYHHRAVLFSVIVANFAARAWKSKLHADGTMYEGMFIVGIETPDGQATYHYDVEPYWSLFRCKEVDRAPEWDGHTPDQAIERIGKLVDCKTDRPTCQMNRIPKSSYRVCSRCGAFVSEDAVTNCTEAIPVKFCPNCRAKVI